MKTIRRIINMVVATAILSSGTVCFADASQTVYENPYNVALGKEVTDVNSVLATLDHKVNIVDGILQRAFSNPHSRAILSSGKVDNAVLEINIGEKCKLAGAYVYMGGNNGNFNDNDDIVEYYHLEYLADDGSWQMIPVMSATQISVKPYVREDVVISDGGVLTNIKSGFNYITFAEKVETDKVRFVSDQPNDGKSKIMREIVILEDPGDGNIAFAKQVKSSWDNVNFYSADATAPLPAFCVDGWSESKDFFMRIDSSAMKNDNYVDIDFGEMKTIGSAQIVTGNKNSGSSAKEFYLMAKNGDEYVKIEESHVKNNTDEVVDLEFPAVRCDGVRVYFPVGTPILVLREVKVFEKVKEGVPVVTVVKPENKDMAVTEDKAEIVISAKDMGGGLENADVILNGKEKEATVNKNGNEYTITVTGLEKGENKIKVRVYDYDNEFGESEEITVTYYSAESFLENFTKCETKEDIGNLVNENKKLLNFEDDDYTNVEKYAKAYEKLLAEKNNIKEVNDFVKIFNDEMAIIAINNASENEIINIISEKFPEIDLTKYNELSSEVKNGVLSQLVNTEFTDEASVKKAIFENMALQSIKYTPWTNIHNIVKEYSDIFNSKACDNYMKLSKSEKDTANKYIASQKNSDKMNSLKGFDDILEKAFKEVEAQKDNDSHKGHGGGGGGGSRPSIGTITSGGKQPEKTQEDTIVNYKPFTDVDKDNPNWAAIMLLSKKGIMVGYGNGKFEPEKKLTREEFAKILVEGFFKVEKNLTGEFSDVNQNDWFYDYVATGKKLGLIMGIEDNKFGTGEYVTREQVATLCYRAALKNGKVFKTDGEKPSNNEMETVSSWAYYPVQVLRMNGMFARTPINPQDAATREEAANLLYEILLMEE